MANNDERRDDRLNTTGDATMDEKMSFSYQPDVMARMHLAMVQNDLRNSADDIGNVETLTARELTENAMRTIEALDVLTQRAKMALEFAERIS